MAVKLRLKRFGRTHHAVYRLGAVDSRKPRQSAVIEELGTYDPKNKDEAAQVRLNAERLEHWLSVGAQPSDTVRGLLRRHGIGKGKI
ncbi:MAG: 30S ribosomal protein S16 [Phycisphaerae bacterium]|nr:30S ribosomal protein S16 [Phycisphaerae bacterium]